MKTISEQELKNAIDQHGLWLSTKASEGEPFFHEDIDLSGIHLKDHNLGEAILPGADFKNSTLERIDLYAANLASCSFVDAGLLSCNFNKSNLDYTVFARAKIRDTGFVRSTFYQSSIENTVFVNCVLDGVHFAQCKIEKSSFEGSSFSKATFSDVELIDCSFSNVTGMESLQVKNLNVVSNGQSFCFDEVGFREWVQIMQGQKK